jgi:hypothetical protein
MFHFQRKVFVLEIKPNPATQFLFGFGYLVQYSFPKKFGWIGSGHWRFIPFGRRRGWQGKRSSDNERKDSGQ